MRCRDPPRRRARSRIRHRAVSSAWLCYRRPLAVGATQRTASIAEGVALAGFMFIAARWPDEFHWHAMSLAIKLMYDAKRAGRNRVCALRLLDQ